MKRIIILTKPVSEKKLERLNKSGEKITFIIPVDLDTLIEGDIETLNNIADKACNDEQPYALSDIGYEAVGVRKGSILIQVTASLDYIH